METWQHILFLADFGMLIVIWLVQLVIYPSFLSMDRSVMPTWHRRYTFRVSWVIMPLMCSQLSLGAYAAFQYSKISHLLSLILILGTWALTFLISVPLHQKIQAGEGDATVIRRLIETNWPRTILWTVIFVLSLLRSEIVAAFY